MWVTLTSLVQRDSNRELGCDEDDLGVLAAVADTAAVMAERAKCISAHHLRWAAAMAKANLLRVKTTVSVVRCSVAYVGIHDQPGRHLATGYGQHMLGHLRS